VHRARIDEQVLELEVRELLAHDARRGTPPQPRRLEHVRLVHGRKLPPPRARELRGRAHDALDLARRVDARVERPFLPPVDALASLLAEVDATGQLAHDDEVDATEPLGLERRDRGETSVHRDRAEIGVHAESPAERQEPLLGPHRRGRIVPLRTADGAEQDRIRLAAEL
jgi:hypothetical protein